MLIDRISLLYGDGSPIAQRLVTRVRDSFPNKVFDSNWHHDTCSGGDLLIALSYPRIVPQQVRLLYGKAIVLHASPVPVGRGWSPANWMLETLETRFTVSRLEMTDRVEKGKVCSQVRFEFPLSGLWNSLSRVLEEAQFSLLHRALSGEVNFMSGSEQKGRASYFPRRTPESSQIDPSKSIVSQWGTIRAADSDRFPNYFFLHGHKYQLTVEDLGEANEH